MNEYDSARIYETVNEIGFTQTKVIDEANCYLLNTCHIRDKAKEKVYHEIGRLKKNFKLKKKPLVIVAGCVAQAENEEMLKREPYIDLVIGPQAYHKINDKIKEYLAKQTKLDDTEFDAASKFNFLKKIKNTSSKVSSYLTIQEGCDKFCHFCVVPYTRGPEYSRPFNEILSEAKNLAENGVKEIILLGQNVNAYKSENYRLSDLIIEIEKIPSISRIRYTTSHPRDMTDDLINVYGISKKLMPLVHLPVQSGSNKILEAMNRKHTIKDYFQIFEKIKNKNPAIRFSSDFIIGYPGETDDDFNKTIRLLKEVEFINCFSFIYSARPGTPAARLKNINDTVAKKRLIEFQKVAYEIKMKYRRSLFGKKTQVLFENKSKNKGEYFGRDEYSNSVITKSNKCLKGKIQEIKIIDGNQNTLFGEYDQKINNEDFAA